MHPCFAADCSSSCDITTEKAIKLSKQQIRVLELFGAMRLSSTCKQPCSFAHAFEAEFHVRSLDSDINDIVDYMIFSNVLSSDRRSTYARDIRLKMFVQKQITGLSLFEELSKEGTGTKYLEVTHVDDAAIYSSTEVDVILTLQAPDFLSRIQQGLFYSSLYHSKSFPISFCRTYNQHTIGMKDVLPFSLTFWRFRHPFCNCGALFIKAQIFSTMQLFDYNPPDKASLYIAPAFTRKPRWLSKFSKVVWPGGGDCEAASFRRKNGRQETKPFLQNCRIQGQLILIDESGGQQVPTKHSS